MVTVTAGQMNSYDSSVVSVRQLEDYIDNFSPKDFPLLKRVGLNSYPDVITNKYFEWQRDEAIPIEDTLHAAITSTTDTSITVHYAEYFALGDVVLMDSELVQVNSIDASANTMEVTRGFAGSTAATHSADITIYRLGSARAEGSSPGWSRYTTVSQLANYTCPEGFGCAA